jgi:hypothetical protein
VVNNAGTVGGKTLVQDDPGPDFQRELDIHLIGPLQINRAAWPHMQRQRFQIKTNILKPWAYTPMVDAILGGTEFGNWMKANLRLEQIAAASALLLHEACPATGQAISVAGGRVTEFSLLLPRDTSILI